MANLLQILKRRTQAAGHPGCEGTSSLDDHSSDDGSIEAAPVDISTSPAATMVSVVELVCSMFLTIPFRSLRVSVWIPK